jgi:hypothetical protein
LDLLREFQFEKYFGDEYAQIEYIQFIFAGMLIDKYSLRKTEEEYRYEFYSKGPKGNIKKGIRFYSDNLKPIPIFNLSFGDLDEYTGEIDDKIVTNNLDREKVLATVAAAVLDFIDDRPGRWVYATGSTKARTRLYQMAINLVYDDIKDKFDIWGELNGDFHKFEKGKNFGGLLLKTYH